MVASGETAQQGWRWDRVEWEEAFELVSLKLSAVWASANGRTPSWLCWRASIQTFGPGSLRGGGCGFSCCFNPP